LIWAFVSFFVLVPAEDRRDTYAEPLPALLCFKKYSIACPVKQIGGKRHGEPGFIALFRPIVKLF
jgi:hypothetical protein